MPQNTMILSSSASQIAAKDGQFGTVFAEGIGGNADMNRDKMVTASELFTFLINRLSPNGQIPLHRAVLMAIWFWPKMSPMGRFPPQGVRNRLKW